MRRSDKQEFPRVRNPYCLALAQRYAAEVRARHPEMQVASRRQKDAVVIPESLKKS